MKIKFIKDFMATQSDDFRDLHAILIKRGDIVDVDGCKYDDSYFDMPKEQAQWLIDNGFAEEVKEPAWVRKQIKEVHGKNIHINYRAVKAFYLPVGEWTSEHKTAFRMEPGDVAGFAGYDEDVKGYINQMVKLGYIEVEDNPNIVWEDEND